SRRTRRRLKRIPIWRTVTTTSRGSTKRWVSRSTPSGTSVNTGACWAATAADSVGQAHEDVGRHLRVQLPRMEGQLLSAQAAGGEDAAVLRRALHDRRDQLHLLSHAEREDPRRLESRNSAGFPPHAQGSQ